MNPTESKTVTIRGHRVLIDASDVELLERHNWNIVKAGRARDLSYVSAFVGGRSILLHREILRAPNGLFVDHKNGNQLDNRRSNLRLCNNQQNSCNQRKCSRPCKSKFKGAYKSARGGWVAQVGYKGTRYYAGFFKTEIEAAKAYDSKAIELHGEFACLNFPKAISK